LQAIATPLVPNMEKVQIIPPPKDVDLRVLAWKGAAVLGKMDGVADLWLTSSDWVCELNYIHTIRIERSYSIAGYPGHAWS
jgi:actin-related protein